MTTKIEFVKENIELLEIGNKQLKKLMDRNNHFTSTKDWERVTVEEHELGYYYKFEATQSKCNIFVTRLGDITRKPRNSKGIEIYYENK